MGVWRHLATTAAVNSWLRLWFPTEKGFSAAAVTAEEKESICRMPATFRRIDTTDRGGQWAVKWSKGGSAVCCDKFRTAIYSVVDSVSLSIEISLLLDLTFSNKKEIRVLRFIDKFYYND